jgi:UDP-glucuronate decarboxylase
MIALMDTEDSFTGPVNMGNPNEISIRELAETIVDLADSRSTIEFRPLPTDDPRQRKPDITLARTKVGWEPKTCLADGLLKTIVYFDRLLGLNRPPPLLRTSSIKASLSQSPVQLSQWSGRE